MNPGELNKRIIFQSYDPELTDDEGFKLPKEQCYSDYKKVWASAKTTSGKEYTSSNNTQNEINTTWRIRYREDISDDMRIKFRGNRFYEIEAILPDDEDKSTLTIVTKEVK